MPEAIQALSTVQTLNRPPLVTTFYLEGVASVILGGESRGALVAVRPLLPQAIKSEGQAYKPTTSLVGLKLSLPFGTAPVKATSFPVVLPRPPLEDVRLDLPARAFQTGSLEQTLVRQPTTAASPLRAAPSQLKLEAQTLALTNSISQAVSRQTRQTTTLSPQKATPLETRALPVTAPATRDVATRPNIDFARLAKQAGVLERMRITVKSPAPVPSPQLIRETKAPQTGLVTIAETRATRKTTTTKVEGARSVVHWVANGLGDSYDHQTGVVHDVAPSPDNDPFFYINYRDEVLAAYEEAGITGFPVFCVTYLGACLHPKSLILSNPAMISISAIKNGLKIATSQGRYRKVNKVAKRQYAGNLISFTTQAIGTTILTSEHPILVVANKLLLWKQAKEVKRGDLLVYPLSSLLQQGKEGLLSSFEKWGDKFVLLPITRLENSSYFGPVYNLVVEESDHFVTSNAIVGTSCKLD